MTEPNANLQRHTLWLRRGDYARLSQAFGPRDIRAAVVIRTIVSRFVDSLEPTTSDEAIAELQLDHEVDDTKERSDG